MRGLMRPVVLMALLCPCAEWIEAVENVRFSHAGSFSLAMRRVSDRSTLLEVKCGGLDLWRPETTVCRPKWGIYD
jgi:hypothetical protein